MMYKTLVSLAVLSFSFGKVLGQSKIMASISNFRNDNGVCRACLFNNAVSFDKLNKPFNCVSVTIKMKTALVVFSDVPPGSYAIMVFHDKNNNNKIDRNFLGIPTEGYGASNNKLPLAASPNFEDNKFIIKDSKPASLNIHLRNIF